MSKQIQAIELIESCFCTAQQEADRRDRRVRLEQEQSAAIVPSTPTLFKRMIAVLATPIRYETKRCGLSVRDRNACSLDRDTRNLLIGIIASTEPKRKPAARTCSCAKAAYVNSRCDCREREIREGESERERSGGKERGADTAADTEEINL